MNIIILGAAGFIGTNLSIGLSKNRENRITIVDRNLENLIKVKNLCNNRVVVHKEDLRTGADFELVLRNQDVVYHLLSSTVPATSNQYVSKEINDNVILMAELLEACVKCNVKKIVFLSSGGTVYGIKNTCPLKEIMETYPINSYGLQKVMNEKLLYMYYYLYGLDYRIIRLANPFGPFQKPNGIQGAVTTFMYRAIKKEKIIVYGDGSVIRDYIYIEDAIRAIINISIAECEEKVFNIGSGKGISIEQVLKVIEKTLNIALEVEYLQGRAVDVPINFLDISRYEDKFGKLITISIEEGIKKTAAFMRSSYFEEFLRV